MAKQAVSGPALRLSVVIPALNEAATIGALLVQLQPLRARGHEVILVDGGSQDGTRELAMDLVDRQLAAPRGRASQLAAGIAVASHDILWLLHADSLLPANADDLIKRVLPMDGVGWGRFDVRLSGRQPLLRVVEWLMNWRSRLTGICTGDQGMFVSRSLLHAVGGMPQLPLMEDVALSRSLRRFARPCRISAPLVTSSRRWEARGVLRTILLMWCLRAAYASGVSPARLARLYQ